MTISSGYLQRTFLLLLVCVTLSACTKNEGALDSSDAIDNPPVTAPADPPAETPPSDTPPLDPPEDEMPPPVDPDPPIDPPAVTDVMLFEQTLYPLLRDPANFCVGCHGATQVPTFALDDLMASYNVLVGQQKVDLQNPANSRVYLRPAVDRHNCGGDASCDVIGAAFLAAIESWAAQVPAPVVPPQAAISGSTSFADAIGAAAARADANLIAKFEFDEGAGTTATDSSGVGTPIVLQLEGTEWVDGGGLRNVSGKAQASLEHSQKVFDAVNASNAYSVEAWVIADDTAQDGPARIVSYSSDTATRNFTLGQNAIYYQLRNRSAGTSANGAPELEALTPEVDTVLQHVVATYDADSGRKVFINGALSIAEDTPDTLDWTNDQLLVLGNEVSGDRLWKGEFKLVALHNKALAASEVRQNFDAGLGDLVALRFDVSDVIGSAGVVELVAKQLDPSAYMFARPTYIGDATDVQVKNIRIAVNGSTPVAAQSFRRIDMVAGVSGALLSPLAAVIPVAEGMGTDQFHLEFEMLGSAIGSAEQVVPSVEPPPVPDVEEPSVGVRTFSQLNDTMSALTGVDANDADVLNLYNELKGQLPATTDLLSFSVSSQIAIQRLAVGYCGEMVNNNGSCNDFFGACEIDGADKMEVADRLFDGFVGDNLATQPMRVGVSTEIVSMIDDLGCAAGCNGAEAITVLNATCAAVLSSSAVTVN